MWTKLNLIVFPGNFICKKSLCALARVCVYFAIFKVVVSFQGKSEHHKMNVQKKNCSRNRFVKKCNNKKIGMRVHLFGFVVLTTELCRSKSKYIRRSHFMSKNPTQAEEMFCDSLFLIRQKFVLHENFASAAIC